MPSRFPAFLVVEAGHRSRASHIRGGTLSGRLQVRAESFSNISLYTPTNNISLPDVWGVARSCLDVLLVL